MRLNISHKTTYSYDDPPIFSAQVIRLTPRTNISQHVVRWRIEPATGLSGWTDAFGNTCHTLVLDEPRDRIDIVASGEVVTSDVTGVMPRDDGELPLEVFLRQTEQTKLDAALREFAQAFSTRISENPLDGLHELMGEIRSRVDYHTGKTDALATAIEAFSSGLGVCQDHAHIFIGCARSLGVPARYVSGYLYDGEQSEAFAAGHAWAAAWVDGLGWVSFDVSNSKSATDSYVSIAVGLDYETAAPIRGVRSGGVGDEELDVAVNVSAVQQ
ncbi:MAG: transglutaminase-like putative cysteine protease [Paracoccaceae bacterium]|jgi:transglutaminase-like putative cysteine protease